MNWSTPLTRGVAMGGLFLLLVGGVAYTSQDLDLQRSRWTKRKADLFFLPSSETLRMASLGHRTFLADLIWIRALLYAGSHFAERGTIQWIPRYVDAITTLDPKFRKAYKWGSSLMIYNRIGASREDKYKSMSLLRKGQKQFPHDYYFPYSLAMSYLHEIKLTYRTYPELEQDHERFCNFKKKGDEFSAKPLRIPIWKIWRMRRRMRRSPSKKWMKLFRKTKRCLHLRAAQLLIEAASKENAPPKIARYAALLLRRGNSSKVIICEHLRDMLWRADNAKMRARLRRQLRGACSPQIVRLLLCQEKLFTQRWEKDRRYISRRLFQFLDLPSHLLKGKPLSYPLPSDLQVCAFRQ